jgi:copper transport protein
VARFTVFASLALLVGAAAFLVLIWPGGRESPGAARLVWGGWIGAFVATIVGIALDGAYAGALPLGDAFKPSVISDVLDTRFGRVWLLRLVLLLVALPLLRLLVNRRPVVEYPLPRWWRPAAVAVAVGLLLTPGLSGHAASGDLVPLAIVADVAHLGGVSLWLGGLVVLLAVVLRRKSRRGSARSCPLLEARAHRHLRDHRDGAFQAWRQLGSLSAFATPTTASCAAKLIAFGVLIITAAFSREIVNRRFRSPRPVSSPPPRVPVTAGGPLCHRMPAKNENGGDDVDEAEQDAWEMRNLRRHVGLEPSLRWSSSRSRRSS